MDHATTSTVGNVDTDCTRDYTSDFQTIRTFKSKEDLIKWAREIGRLNDFVIVTLRSDSGEGNKRPRVTLGCERSGTCDGRITPKKTMTVKYGRRHTTGTKKCGCPFRLMGKKQAAGDEWELKVVVGRHNHALGHLEEGHSFAGKLSPENKSLLKDMFKEGAKPKEIFTKLQSDEHNKSKPRTIYNGCQRLRYLGKLQSFNLKLQQVMRNASKYDYIEKHRLNPKADNFLDFFCTYPTSLELLSAFPRVLGIECWRDWDSKMTKLNIFGITSTHIPFWVAIAYLSSEHKSSCGWALSTLRGAMDDKGVAMPDVIILTDMKEVPLKPLTNAIDDVFRPAKIWLCDKCAISRHVRNYCRRIFRDSDNFWGQLSFAREWDLLVESPTEAEYDEQLNRLHTEFSMYPEALAYVTNTWLKPHKKKFVAAWTDHIMHFGAAFQFSWSTAPVPFLFFHYYYFAFKIDKFWKAVDASVENVHRRIKDSFVESLTNKKEEYENREYRELRRVVSIFALRKIREQTTLADKKDTYHSVCNCAIKRTHGLPCAHEIAKYRTEGRPIPLDCIHPHWKKLDSPLTRTAESGVDKMMKMNNSTPSAPLLSEIVESRQRNSPNTGLSILHSNQERQPEAEDKVYHNQSTKPLEFVHAFPVILSPYILDVKDVASDGHCGFRAIASLLGNSDEDGWVKVRKDLMNELKFNAAHYAQLFRSDERVNELLHALSYFGDTCLDHKEHWMTMPDMGHIIASCYNVILTHLSYVQCFTFFPLRIAPISVPSLKEIAIGFVNEHFVQVFLIPGHPMPPTVPALTKKYKNMPHDVEPVLERIHQQCFEEWATPYNGRMDNFKSLQPRVVVSQENPTVLDFDHVPSVDYMDDFFGSLH